MRRRYFRYRFNNIHKIAALTIIIILLAILTGKINHDIRPIIKQQAETIADRETNDCITRAVSEYINNSSFSYSDFSTVIYDENGRAVSIEARPVNINLAQSDLTTFVNNRLKDRFQGNYELALGTLTDSPLLIGKGPHINVRICPVGSANVKLKSCFDSAGLNQTRHSIIAVIDVRFTSAVPMYSFEGDIQFDFLLAETVIVGDVPDLSGYAWDNIGG